MTARPIDAPEAVDALRVVTLNEVQAPVRDDLQRVHVEMEQAITRDIPMLAVAARHLLAMKGKMFRPTLVLLSSHTARSEERRVG